MLCKLQQEDDDASCGVYFGQSRVNYGAIFAERRSKLSTALISLLCHIRRLCLLTNFSSHCQYNIRCTEDTLHYSLIRPVNTPPTFSQSIPKTRNFYAKIMCGYYDPAVSEVKVLNTLHDEEEKRSENGNGTDLVE
jgi:hypothetical protein